MGICRIDGCEMPVKVKARKMCSTHYEQARRRGELEPMVRAKGQPVTLEWMQSKTRAGSNSRVDELGECREWTMARKTTGYGQVIVDGVPTPAHRALWELVHGPVQEGLDVMHECDNRLCIRLDHLSVGTRGKNIRDAVARGRMPCTRKLTPAGVRLMREWHRRGRSIARLAREFGVGYEAARNVVNRKTWKHVV